MISSKKEANQNQSFYMAEPKKNEEYIHRLVNGILDRRLKEKSYYDKISSKIEATASYIIRKDGSKTVAIDGHTGNKVKKDTDAAIVIQYAIDQLTSGGKIFIKKGTYTLSSTQAITGRAYTTAIQAGIDGISLIGEGRESTILKLGNNIGGNIISFDISESTFTYITIAHLTLDGNKTNQAASGVDGDLCGIRGYGSYYPRIIEVEVKNCMRQGVYLTNCSWGYYQDILVSGCSQQGFVWDSEALSKGVNIKAVDNTDVGIMIVGGAARENAYVTVLGGEAHGNIAGGFLVKCAIGVSIYGAKSYGNGDASHRFDGFLIRDSEDVYLTDCQAYENYRAGAIIYGSSTRIQILGGCYFNNRYNGVDTSGSGVYIFDSSSYVRVIGIDAYDNRGTPYQKYGVVDIDADYTSVRFCDLRNNMDGALSLAGVHSTAIDNIGYVSENGGAAAAVADGGTIAHGLATTPTYVSVVGSVAGEMVQVTALGAANITVAIKQHDGSAGTSQTIYWRAWI